MVVSLDSASSVPVAGLEQINGGNRGQNREKRQRDDGKGWEEETRRATGSCEPFD